MLANSSAKINNTDLWVKWRSKLHDRNLPASAAYHFATRGTVEERFELTHNESLPLDVVLILIEDPHEAIYSGVITCPSITSDLLLYASELHPELQEIAGGEPNAALRSKLGISLEETTTRSLLKFFEDVKADEVERGALQTMCMTDPQRSLGDAWKLVRAE